MVNGWLRNAQSVLFPPNCILCGDQGQLPVLDLCSGCAADLPRNRRPCRQCAMPLDHEGAHVERCGDCLTHVRPVVRTVAPYLYGYPLDHLVRSFKYDGELAYGRVLGTLLAAHVAASTEPLPELLVPVPLHIGRHRERGFNQTIELARHVGSLLGIRVDDGLCRRVRATEDQAKLPARERRGNLRGAFVVARRPRVSHVAILDDVMTTGSTLNELASVLVAAGVQTVEAWALARSVG